MPPEAAQRLASSVPLTAILRLDTQNCPEGLLDELSRGRRL